MTPDDVEGVIATDRSDSPSSGPDRERSSFTEPSARAASSRMDAGVGERRGAHEYDEHEPQDEGDREPDRTARVYVGLWLPAAGAVLAYAVLRQNFWAAFIGAELLLVGWFTLGKLS